MSPRHNIPHGQGSDPKLNIKRIIKRNLQEVDFDVKNLQRTLSSIRRQQREFSRETQEQLQTQILRRLVYKQGASPWPSVLQLQDAIEHSLWVNGYFKSAKCFIDNRAQRRFNRQQLQRLRLLIQAMRSEISQTPLKEAPKTQNQSECHQNWQALCLNLLEQTLDRSPNRFKEYPELSEALKTQLRHLPTDKLNAFLDELNNLGSD